MTEKQATLEAAQRLSHTPLLTTLEQKVDPGHAALIVVDMQNDFCAPGGMMDEEGADISAVQAMAKRLPDLIDAARGARALVVFIRNVYSTEANSYLSDVYLEQAARRRGGSYTVREVCGPDSWEGDFYEGIRPLPGEPIVTKHRYGAFHNTDLETILRAHRIRTVVLTGVATNVCVETTAREAFLRDFYVVFTADGTASYADDTHEATLRTIDKYFVPVVSVAEVADIWRRPAAADVGDPRLVAPAEA
ncbi:MAG: cysteine hydrolase family protein [Solirubrobacteraceae bacterium]